MDGVKASNAATLAIIGPVGYVWTRIAIGYPNIPTVTFAVFTFAVIRYGGLVLAAGSLQQIAFAAESKEAHCIINTEIQFALGCFVL